MTIKNLLSPQWTIFGNKENIQDPFDVAIVTPSIGRNEIAESIKSVYAQSEKLSIQFLIGFDILKNQVEEAIYLLKNPPSNVTPCIFFPGYSTSIRHGGLHLAKDGGALRCILTHIANSKYITYLDDDNTWDKTHLSDLMSVVKGPEWAFALRYFIHPNTKEKLCIDQWESVGLKKGIFAERFGGFVDPNCLIFNKLKYWQCVSLWNMPLQGDEKGMSADRNIFNYLSHQCPPGETNRATVNYLMDPNDGLHNLRLSKIDEHIHRSNQNK